MTTPNPTHQPDSNQPELALPTTNAPRVDRTDLPVEQPEIAQPHEDEAPKPSTDGRVDRVG